MRSKRSVICILSIFFIICCSINNKIYAVSGNAGENVKVTYNISSPDGGNLSTVTGQVEYDKDKLEYVGISSTAGIANGTKVSATESQINGKSMSVTVTFKIKSNASGNISTKLNLSELYTTLSETNHATSITGTVSVTAPNDNDNSSNNGSTNNGASNNGSSSNSSNGSSSSNTSNGNSSGNSTQRPSTSTETKKSSNANLKNLGINPNDFNGFKSGTTAYNVTVPNDVEQVKVYATAQDSKSKITGTGNKKLTVGKNKLDVVVTAEDGTTKTYTINVTREEAAVTTNETIDDNSSTETQENTQNNTTEDNTDLKNLTISGYTLTPSFSPNVYEYKLDVKGDISSLDIQTEGANHSVSTDIAGNENLKDGENIITINVYNEETKKNSTYQIIVNKMTASSEDLNVTLNNAIKKANKIRYIFFGTVIFIVVASIVFIIVRHNMKKEDNEDENESDEIYDYNKKENERLNLDDEDELFSRVNKDEKKGKHF